MQEEICRATLNDLELQMVISAVKEEKWNEADSSLSPYCSQDEQLTVSECGILLRNLQIVIPRVFVVAPSLLLMKDINFHRGGAIF